MFNFIQKYRSKFKTKEAFELSFFKDVNHTWISNDRYLKSSFEELFSLIPLSLINEIYTYYDSLIILESGESSLSAFSNIASIEIDFKHKKELRSFNPSEAHALLIYKIGILLSSFNETENSNAQTFADGLALQLGFETEIENIIQREEESIDKRVRLSYLTSKVFTLDN